MKYRIEVVTDAERFVAVRDAWQCLWVKSGGYIFQSHDWISGWLGGVTSRRDIKLLTALAWDADRLAGVMPCAVHKRRGFGVLHFTAQSFSDFCDCLIDPEEDRAVVLAQLWAGLVQAAGFDLINLQQIRPDACCRAFFESLPSAGAAWRVEPQERCLRIDNHWPNGVAFFRSLNKKARNNHTRGKRILTELGGDVRFSVVEPGDPAGTLIEEILRLKEIWLRANDPRSPMFGPDGAVLRKMIDHARLSGLAKIFTLQTGGKIAAASINFVYHDRVEAYLTSYDAEFERASPGTILIVESAQWCFDRKMKLIDFLRGEEAFKFRLANAETLLSTVKGARTLVGHMALSGHRWLTRLYSQRDFVESNT